MRTKRIAILAGAAAVLVAGAAQASAAQPHRMTVALPDGSLARIEYVGEAAPAVTVVPAEARLPVAFDPFAGMERIAAMMEARHRAMMLQMAALQRLAAQAEAAPGAPALVGTLPAGVRYTMVSSTTDATGCTRTVRYSSDGGGGAPQVTRASAGTCDAPQSAPAVVEASVSAPAEAQAPGHEV